ncbi:MAG: hypothetical protein K5889_09105 [Lachnospiraceae bacterium]|nr:hypothetical protein [Lachnospiraceae bacterium]
MDQIRLVQVLLETWGAVLCSVFALALVLIRKEEPRSSRYLSLILWNVVVLLTCDALAIFYRGGSSTAAWYCTRICNFLVYFISSAMPFFAVLFLSEVLKDHMVALPRHWVVTAGLLEVVSLAFLFVSQWNRMLYYIDDANLYHRGDFYILSQVVPYFTTFLYILILIQYRMFLTLGERVALWLYVALPLFAAVLQTMFYGLSLTNIAMGISAIVMIVQRITAKSFLLREARIRIEQERHQKEEMDPSIDERLQKATIGKGNVKHIFIVNPNAGNFSKVEQLRAVISKLPEQDYFIFTTRGPADETELVRQIQHYFVGYKLRIYCCGGSGTIRNVMNGIADLARVEIGFCPCGMTNDFLKVFGKDMEKFNHIENLIEGNAIPVDYIRTNHGVALNTFSTGMDSNILNGKDRYKTLTVFGQNVPYMLSMFRSSITTRARDYIIEMDGKDLSCRSSQIIFGNGRVIGGNLYFTENADIEDGKANFFLANERGSLRLLPTAFALMKKQYRRLPLYGKVGQATTISVRRRDGMPLEVDFDGEMVYGYSQWEAQIVHKGMNLIVPKGVMIHE